MYQGVRVIWEESSLRETNNKVKYCPQCAKEKEKIRKKIWKRNHNKKISSEAKKSINH